MTPIPRGPRTWVASALCALAVCASLYTLTGLIAPGAWLPVAAGSVVALAGVLAGVRTMTRTRWAPTSVGLGAIALAVLARYASPPDRFQPVPNAESLARLADAVRAGLAYANISRPPVDPTGQLELLVVGGALLVMLVVDLVAMGLAAPAWSGLVVLSLWLPGIVLGSEASAWVFAAVGTAYLALLALTAAPAPGPRGAPGRGDATRRTGAAVTGAALVTVAAIALGPVAAAVPWWSTAQLPTLGSASAGSLQLASTLDLRESLGARSDGVELTYRAEPVAVGPLRVFTLRDFDGESWSRDAGPSVVASHEPLLWPARDLASRPPGEGPPTVSDVTVRIVGLREDRLPVPVMPRTVNADGRWRYDAQRDEVVRAGRTPTGTTYALRVEVLDLTAADLRAAGTDYPPDLKPYLAVPRTSRSADVAAVAARITANASNPFDQALALQSYLRSPLNFTYSTKVPAPRSHDAVWDFLGDRTGYCVQFATALTVLARTLGIPARLAVGFLPGTLDTTGEHVVTGRDAHAWPELYFPTIGWVRFEPTPAVQSGAPPSWADPFAASASASPHESPAPQAVVPSGSPTPRSRATTTTPTKNSAPVAWAGAVAIALVAVWLARRRTARSGVLGPEAAWARVRARAAAAGITWTDGRTPRQVAALVAAELTARHGSIRAEADAALRDIARAVEDERYALHPRAWADVELEHRVGVVLREIMNPVRVADPSGHPRRGGGPSAVRTGA